MKIKYTFIVHTVLCIILLVCTGFSSSTNSGNETVIINDVKAWNHPTKKIFEKYKVGVKKIELKNDGKYPVFYVRLPYDPQSSANDKYYDKLYLELLRANGWWNYSLDDQEDGIIISVTWDKKSATMHKDFTSRNE
jgi:hypothetical protein